MVVSSVMWLPWDEDRWCEWTPRNVRRRQPAENGAPAEDRCVPEQPQGDLIAVIVRALAPFEDARRAVVDAIRSYGGISPCPG
jgi:hypothetical protein